MIRLNWVPSAYENNMQNITTREATLADMDILLQFEQGVIVAERPFDSTLKQGDVHYYNISELITAPHIHMVVAELNGELIGSGYARIENSEIYIKHPQYAYLGFMYVLPHHRGKGVNKLVIEKLQNWAVEKGITEFRLQVYYDNLPAIKAYEKIGFIRDMIKMRMGV